MERILKCKDKIFTGNSISDVEMDFFDWLGGARFLCR